MKKHSAEAIITILLISLFFEAQPLVRAGYFYPHPMDPYIVFNSPINNSYQNVIGLTTLDIDVGTITLGQAPGESYELTYSLDGQQHKSLSLEYKGIFSDNSMPHSVYSSQISLPSLSEGNHTVAAHCIFRVDGYTLTSDNRVNFNIDKTPPKLLVLTVENKTYDAADLPLNFTVNEVCYLSYRLDGEYVSIEGNTTLEGLCSGEHSLTVYAQDRAGNSDSQTMLFSVRETTPIMTVVVIPIAIILLVSAGLVIYFKKNHNYSY